MNKNKFKIFGVVCGIAGFLLVAWIAYPIFSYQINAPRLMTFLSPISDNSQSVLADSIDYTKADTWFPQAKENGQFQNNPVSFYTLSIPRLNIKDATVAIGGEDLSESLIQYPGTSLPGQLGNPVIFGHSVLPAFYNPKNYLTIFSTIPTLVKGDVITVDYDGITYKYAVEEKYEVLPTDIGILSQDQSDSFLTLVTCAPPGLTTYREIVKARVVPVAGS